MLIYYFKIYIFSSILSVLFADVTCQTRNIYFIQNTVDSKMFTDMMIMMMVIVVPSISLSMFPVTIGSGQM